MFYKCKQYAYRRMQLHVSQTEISMYMYIPLTPSSVPRLFITYIMIYIYVINSLGTEDALTQAWN